MNKLAFLCALSLALVACANQPPVESYDVLIRNGTVYDGSGAAGTAADLGIRGGKVVAVGDLTSAQAKLNIDATGLAVAPGFINMLSWATESLIEDGRALSDVKQGVTLEVMGEGWSMGPLTST